MERHKCRICYKNFANGRALGGHMRSHMLNLQKSQGNPAIQISESASEEEEEEEEEEEVEVTENSSDKGLYYALRENPKRSFRLVDPEFSFAAEAGSLIVLQDRESETESSKNPTRRRSKRTRTLMEEQDEYNFKASHKLESLVEQEPASSISDTSTEEDVAFCLMMLSRDKWKTMKKKTEQYEDDEEESFEESDESLLKSSKIKNQGKYWCETCNKVFKSYQALGGHRASHKKMKAFIKIRQESAELSSKTENAGNLLVVKKKAHECPYCYRVFSSGQALGGHKRSHVTGSTTTSTARRSKFIDLNLPAPMEDDDLSQIELSALSDAEFVNNFRR